MSRATTTALTTTTGGPARAKLDRLLGLASEVNRALAEGPEIQRGIGHRTFKRCVKASKELMGAIAQARADAGRQLGLTFG
jgi:hypothetical protein